MSADKVRYEEGISKKLEALGCRQLERIDDYHTLWVVIETDVAFSVPHHAGDRCPAVMWPYVLADVAKAKIKPY